MGHLYRMVEPTILYLLASGKARYGYEFMERAHETELTDSEIDAGAIYRTLRALEGNGYVVSRWEVGEAGPDRRLYEITAAGRDHLGEWAALLARLGASMVRFSEVAEAV
jgi:PadR family transcriptional regulator PadR